MAAASEPKEKFTFFWRSQSPFSQWHPSMFVVNEITYTCAEQYMMHQKAVLFGDEKIADDILNTNNPRAMKGFGRRVENFDGSFWERKCQDVVKTGSMAKFSQNEDLKKVLFKTAGTTLVEASPHDHIWGIGLAENDPKAYNKSTWKGRNLLGYILTDVRKELMEQESHNDSGKAN